MAEGKLQPADSEDSALPGAEPVSFDLSADSSAVDGNGVGDEQQPETDAQSEPEGIFTLFDREFPEGEREPIEPEESSEFDREFAKSFETMFEAVKGDGSAPLFSSASEPESVPTSPEPSGDDVLPRVLNFAEDEEPKEVPLIDPSAPVASPPLFRSPGGLPSLPSLSEEPQPRRLEQRSEDEFPEEIDLLTLEEPTELPLEDPEDPADEEPSDELDSWSADAEGLEELSFDDSDEEDLYDEDLSGLIEEADEDTEVSFDDFAKLALGLENEADSEDEEDDDFTVEELSSAPELDPFEDIAIMSSEDVANYEPSFGEDGLKFQDEEPLPDDPDPFAMEGEASSKFATPEEDYDPLKELDPFGEEAAALAAVAEKKEGAAAEPESEDEPEEDKPEKKEKKEKKRSASRSNGGAKGSLLGLLLFPWKIYSALTGIVFRLLEALIGLLGKIPLIGIPFKLLGSVLGSIPMALKRVIVLVVIAVVLWGGSSLVGSFIPKPSAEIALPDSGSASFVDVALIDGKIRGEIQNTGEVNVHLIPQVQIQERKLLEPATWFSPIDRGTCKGDLVSVPIGGTAAISYGCDVATADGMVALSPALNQ